MKNASLIKEPLGCYIKYINNLALQYVHFSVMVESLAFRQPRKIMATFIEYLPHERYCSKIFVHINQFSWPPRSLWVE